MLRTDQHPDSGASAKASAAWSRIVPPAVAHNESRGFAQLTAPSAVSTSDKEETLRLLALAQQRFANTYGAADHDQCFEKLGAHITGSRSGDARADTIPDSGEANDQKDTVGSDSMGGEG